MIYFDGIITSIVISTLFPMLSGKENTQEKNKNYYKIIIKNIDNNELYCIINT